MSITDYVSSFDFLLHDARIVKGDEGVSIRERDGDQVQGVMAWSEDVPAC